MTFTELGRVLPYNSGRLSIRMSVASTDHVVLPEGPEAVESTEGAAETDAPSSPSPTSDCPRASSASSRRTV